MKRSPKWKGRSCTNQEYVIQAEGTVDARGQRWEWTGLSDKEASVVRKLSEDKKVCNEVTEMGRAQSLKALQ